MLASPAAFDLTPAPGGVLLAWGDADGRVVLEMLDTRGHARGSTRARIRATDRAGSRAVAQEIAMAVANDRAVLLWLAADEARAEVRSALADTRTGEIDAALTLSASERAALGKRGHVAVAATSSGRLMAMVRGEREACRDGHPETCSSISIVELPQGASPEARPRLVVPTSCEPAIVGIATAGEHWYYAVCSLDGTRESTTLFTARQEPAYAQAHHLLFGCTPLALAAIGSDLWLMGQCGGVRAAHRVRGIEADPRARGVGEEEPTCDGGHLVLDMGGHRIALAEAGAHLAPMLPPRLALKGARAVWTEDALVIAQPSGQELELSSYRCDGEHLVRQ